MCVCTYIFISKDHFKNKIVINLCIFMFSLQQQTDVSGYGGGIDSQTVWKVIGRMGRMWRGGGALSAQIGRNFLCTACVLIPCRITVRHLVRKLDITSFDITFSNVYNQQKQIVWECLPGQSGSDCQITHHQFHRII